MLILSSSAAFVLLVLGCLLAGLVGAPVAWKLAVAASRIASAPFRWLAGLPARGLAWHGERAIRSETLRRLKAEADEAEQRAINEQLKRDWSKHDR